MRFAKPRPRVFRMWLASALAVAAACDHPIAVVTPHAEIADIVLVDSISTGELARTNDNRTWSGGPLTLCDGTTRTLTARAIDFRGQPVELASRRDLDLRAESEEPLVSWEPLQGRGRLTGLAVGRTRVRFLVWHETHADMVTPWLDIHVTSAASCADAR
ncbi:MAG: hypothetical protein IBJ03_05340 [Gemmatimonadaceae bacterium]|nr:hypothetical protein [Gemmatimonadaceae bacterium]